MGIDPDDSAYRGASGVMRLISSLAFRTASLYYLVAAGLFLPLYLPGYNTLGTDKSKFWILHLKITLWMFAGSAVLFLVSLIVRTLTEDDPHFSHSFFTDHKKKTLPHEIWTVLFAVCTCISYALSERKDIAYLGESNWYIGTWEYIAMCLCILVIGRTLLGSRFFTGIMLLASFAVFAIGMIFDITGDRLEIDGWNTSKMSTVGNINWFCGYMVCVLFVSAACYITACSKNEKDTRVIKTVSAIVFGSGAYCFFSQGSSSGYPAALAAFVIMLFYCAKDLEKHKYLAELSVIFSAGGLVHATFAKLGAIERSNDDVTKFLDGPVFLLFLLTVSLIIMFMLRGSLRSGRKETRICTGRAVLAVIFALLVIYAVAVTVNTLKGGFLGTGPVLYFGEDWASSRGMTISTGLTLFGGMSFTEKLFGTGPDTFYSLIYSGRFPELAERVTDYFGGARLTNAHCEPVTMLVNTGIAGTVCFYGMLVALAKETYRAVVSKHPDSPFGAGLHTAALSVSVGIIAYMVNNLFSFQTAMNLSQLSLLVGFGASAVRGLSKAEDK